MRTIKFSFLLCLFIFWQNIPAQVIQFWGEKIEITIHGASAAVRGQYYFVNQSDQTVPQTLFYPFMINENLPFPDSISVQQKNQPENLPYQRQNAGVFFSIFIPARDTIVNSVYYLQKTPAKIMEYILTTTERWKEPLSFAEYTIRLPQPLTLKYLSMYPSEKSVSGEYQIFKILKNNYLPQTNLIIKWNGK